MNVDFDDILDQELGPVVKHSDDQQVKVREGIPGKSSQDVLSWVEIRAHSSDDAESLLAKLRNASINYPDVAFKQSGSVVIAQINPIRVEIPYINGIVKVASQHGVEGVVKKFQVVDV